LIHQKVEILHVLDERHRLFVSALLDSVSHLLRVPDRLTFAVSLRPVRRIHVWRFLFVYLIFLQQSVAIPANVLEFVEDDEIRVAVGANHLREWIV
jgi:hypothetical protein